MSTRFAATACTAVLLAAAAAPAATAPADTAAVHQASDVVVTASRYGDDVHLSHANLTREELAGRIGVADIPLLLEDTPGLHAWSDAGNGVGYTYLNIRGFDQKRVGVMIDGIPLNDPEDHQVYWVDLPDLASSVQDVQVQRGITNSLGATTAIGGTVNLVTDLFTPERELRLSLMGGSYGTWKQTASYQTGLLDGRFQSALRLSRLESDGYRDRTGSKLWGLFWSARYLTENSTTRAKIYTGREESQHGWNAAFEDDLAADRRHNPETYADAVDDFRQPHYELHHQWRLSDRFTAENAVFWIHGEGFYENLKEGVDAADFSLDALLGLDPDAAVDLVRRKNVDKNQVGWVSHLQLRHGGGRTIVGGDIYDFHSDHWGDVLRVDGMPGGPGEDLRYYGYTGDKQAWSVYVNEMWEAVPGLTLLADLQLQHKQYRFEQDAVGNFTGADRHAYRVDYDFFNPKGGIHWELPSRPFGGRAALYAHVGKTHREPADGELFDTWDGPDDVGVSPLFRESVPVDEDGDGTFDYLEWSDPYVRQERAVDYELGASWRGERVSLTLNGYWMDFDHEIIAYGAVDDDGAPIRGNADKTLHRGVELGLAARLTDTHTLKVAASTSWDEFDTYVATFDPDTWSAGAFDQSGNPLALFPRHLASVALVSDFGALDSRLRLRSVGRQHLDNTGDAARTIAGYVTLDLAAGVDLGGRTGRTRLNLRVNNLLDEMYETTGYWYDQAGDGRGR
ncbi:TonB-dependent receptor, partial [bacterium]|nr:TonB-dependent receptor [bacterium]